MNEGCKGYWTPTPFGDEFDCGYDTNIYCEECKYGRGDKDPENDKTELPLPKGRRNKIKDTFLICPYIPDHEMSEIRKSQDPTIKRLYSAIVHMSTDYDQLKDQMSMLTKDFHEEVENTAKHVHCDVCQEKIAELEAEVERLTGAIRKLSRIGTGPSGGGIIGDYHEGVRSTEERVRVICRGILDNQKSCPDVVQTNVAGWRWYLTMWDKIINNTYRGKLDDEYLLSVKHKDMKAIVTALKEADAEVERLRKIVGDPEYLKRVKKLD
jgi:uncharacterized coiled-coil protein SlyX